MSRRGIVVTGASRGIGAALARALAGPDTRLMLVGRDSALLAEVALACEARGALAEVGTVDVREREAMADCIHRFDRDGSVDLVVANAGVALSAGDDAEMTEASYGEIDINFAGALNTILPAVPLMRNRGRGQLAFVSSLAAFVPLPSSPGYSASKAALLVYGLALRERLGPAGIRVSVICPGYVETDMGARYKGWRPLEMSPDAAAGRIVRGLAYDRPVIAFPRSLTLVARLSTFVPERVRRLGLTGFSFSIDRQ